jgi:uncharacterized integral membrane protein
MLIFLLAPGPKGDAVCTEYVNFPLVKMHMKTFLLFTFAASSAHSVELFLLFYQPLSCLKHVFFLLAFLVCLIIVFKRRHADQRLHERTSLFSEAHYVSFW